MKKIILKISAVCAIAVTATIGLNISASQDNHSSLSLKNIEAMAQEAREAIDLSKAQPYSFECGGSINNGQSVCKFNVVTCQGGGSGCTPRPCSVHG